MTFLGFISKDKRDDIFLIMLLFMLIALFAVLSLWKPEFLDMAKNVAGFTAGAVTSYLKGGGNKEPIAK